MRAEVNSEDIRGTSITPGGPSPSAKKYVPEGSETGSGALVRNISPTIVTPTIASLTNMQHNHQNAAGGGSLAMAAISDLPTLAAGVYTPTLTNQLNISSSAAYQCQYMRVGSVVTVSGRVSMTPTATGACLLYLTLPVASVFTLTENLGGTAMNDGGTSGAGSMNAVNLGGGSNVAKLSFTAAEITARDWYFTFTYHVQ